MSDNTGSTNLDTTAERNDLSNRLPSAPVRHNKKLQLSCTLCRKRKLRCDRRKPCETCIRRGLSLSCTYIHSVAASTSNRPEEATDSSNTSTNLQERLGQLEKLVVSLMQNSNVGSASGELIYPNTSGTMPPADEYNSGINTEPFSSIPPGVPDRIGRIKLTDNESAYFDNSHWLSLLDGISEMKDNLDNIDIAVDTSLRNTSSLSSHAVHLLSRHPPNLQKEEILAGLPPRAIADDLLELCFENVDLTHIMLHTPTFRKEYERFWDRPSETPIMWIGLLFIILCCGSIHSQASTSSQGLLNTKSGLASMQLNHDTFDGYLEKTIQCLLLGDYTNTPPYTIETLILYFYVEYQQKEDSQIKGTYLLALIVRMSMRMGYHRDGIHFPQMSPFAAEMRRRVWAVIVDLDTLMSSALGIPRMISESRGDTQTPRSFFPDDFHEAIPELPQARPDTEQTPVMFFVCKSKISSIFARVCDLVDHSGPMSYTDVLNLDNALTDAYSSFPSWVRPRSIADSSADSLTIICARIFLAVLFHKTQCVLHRRFLQPGRTDGRYAYSHSTCLEACLNILQYQSFVHLESQPGRKLYPLRWKFTAMVKNDFLLATTILCLAINHEIEAKKSSSLEKYWPSSSVTQEVVLEALQRSCEIWSKSIGTSDEAQKATRLLQVVLDKHGRMDLSPAIYATAAQDLFGGDVEIGDYMDSAEAQWIEMGNFLGN